jgi:hypothetical protein
VLGLPSLSQLVTLLPINTPEDIASLSLEGPMAPYTAKRKLQLGFLIAKSGSVGAASLSGIERQRDAAYGGVGEVNLLAGYCLKQPVHTAISLPTIGTRQPPLKF